MKTEKEIIKKMDERTEAMKVMGAAQRRDTEIFVHGLKWCLGIRTEAAIKVMSAAQNRDTEIFIHGLKWCLGITD